MPNEWLPRGDTSIKLRSDAREPTDLASLIGVENHTPQHQAERERARIVDFFGPDFSGILVPKPPKLLTPTMDALCDIGFRDCHVIRFPDLSLEQARNYPGWHTKPGDYFYDKFIEPGLVRPDILKLSGRWAIIDATPRPTQAQIRLENPNDPLGKIIANARANKQIVTHEEFFENLVPPLKPPLDPHSRTRVAPEDQDRFIFPALANELELTANIESGLVEIRRPFLAELMYAGLTRFPEEFGSADTVEYTQDGFTDGMNINGTPLSTEFSIISGDALEGGLAQARHKAVGINTGGAHLIIHVDGTYFRPLFVFNQAA
jgi:hypothetical protein